MSGVLLYDKGIALQMKRSVIVLRQIGRNRIFILVFTTLLLVTVVLLSAIPGSPLSLLTSPLSVVLEPVQKTLIGVTDSGVTRDVQPRRRRRPPARPRRSTRVTARFDRDLAAPPRHGPIPVGVV